MANEMMNGYRNMFMSRLDTLSHVLAKSVKHFEDNPESILSFRIIEDMANFGTQIAYTCNQARSFALWCENKETSNLDAEVNSLSQANDLISTTKAHLSELSFDDSKLEENKRVKFGDGNYIDFTGLEYIHNFLLPNLYFHLTTAYDIMRMKGVPVGKVDYMSYLLPLVRQG